MSSMRETLDEKLARFEELEQKLIDPEVLTNAAKMSAVAREHGRLRPLAVLYRDFRQLNEDLVELKEMLESSDPDERELAEVESTELREKRERHWEQLLDVTVGGEDAARTRCMLEIRAGIGGDEAALFARDLYEMYKRYAETKRWKIEVLGASPTELGGFKEITLGVTGEGVFRELQYESGGHRVQRVPETETKGRVHTSAATVAVMPEPEDIEVELGPDDYRKDIYHASGPGGQHVNKTASAIRLTHFETGMVVAIQDEKSQHKNLAKGIRILKSRLYDHYQQIEHQKRSAHRKSLVGSGDRSQRIRTYNFPENRLTDHRVPGLTLYKLDQIIAGDIGPIVEALLKHERDNLRESMGGLD
ncbi:MAG: peptide chain release factor 1 [Pirellulaceae bacterium]